MRISEHIYKLSGVEFKTNSNTYAITAGDELILIDAGYQQEQWQVMQCTMKKWNLDKLPITHVFITHSHFDHAGNVWRANELGAKVISSDIDAQKIMYGNPEMELLFGATWKCGIVDETAHTGDCYEFHGGIRIKVLATPGHSAGSLSYLIEADGIRALCTSDMFFVIPVPPKDNVSVELGYMGSSDFNLDSYIESLKLISQIKADILLPGHYYCYFGDVQSLCRIAYKKALQLKIPMDYERDSE